MYDKQLDFLFKKQVLNYINGQKDNAQIDLLQKEVNKKLGDVNGVGFRSLRRWTVQLEILYGIMWVRNITVNDLAEQVGCTGRTIERYIFEGCTVPEERKEKIAEVLKINKNVLFYRLQKSKNMV